MNYNRVFIRGDTHGDFSWLPAWCIENHTTTDDALIILGDAGINFYLNKTDRNLKRNIQNTGYTIYCVRGNHEERPENLPNLQCFYNTFRLQGAQVGHHDSGRKAILANQFEF